jgi:hypothetical protein
MSDFFKLSSEMCSSLPELLNVGDGHPAHPPAVQEEVVSP